MRQPRSDKKYKFTKAEIYGRAYSALVWASDGLAWHVEGREGESQALVMGDPDSLAKIIAEALTVGLPDGEDSSASTTI